jgi:hypothetical protein
MTRTRQETHDSKKEKSMSSIAAGTFQAPPPAYTLFDANAVGTATFFGTPVMGCYLMAVNYRRLGQASRAATTLLLGIAVTGLVILLGWNLPQPADLPIAVVLVFATRWSAQNLQGAEVADHVQRGGRLGSKWTAFWLGTAFLVALFAVVFVAVYIANQRSGVVIGTKDEVFYSGSATKDQAQALGNDLKTMGYFTDKGANVFVAKGKDGTIVSFVVKDGVWNDPAMVAGFEKIARQEAPTVGGLPITLRLVNTSLAVEKSEVLN